MTADDCFNAAAWQRAVANDYSKKAFFAGADAQNNFKLAADWHNKSVGAFLSGNGSAAQWYQAIANDYARKAAASSTAGKDFAAKAKLTNAAAAGNEDRGRWLQSCGDAETCPRLIRPPGLTDAQWFTTVSQLGPSTMEVDLPPEVSFCEAGEVCAASASARPCKKISNPRRKKEPIDLRNPGGPKATVIEITLETRWCHKGGAISRMDPANAHCKVTSFGLARGWRCANPDGHPVFPGRRTGGNPEHGAWIYSFDIYREVWVPVIGSIMRVQEDRWCAGNQVSASMAHKRHGRCSLQPW